MPRPWEKMFFRLLNGKSQFIIIWIAVIPTVANDSEQEAGYEKKRRVLSVVFILLSCSFVAVSSEYCNLFLFRKHDQE